MAVQDGALVNAAYTNSKLLSKTVDDSKTGKLGLNDPSSTALTDVQKDINDIFDTTGMSGESDANRKVYSSNNVVTNGDNRKVAIGKLDAEFNESTGHAHSGAAGDGGVVSASNLGDFNKYWAVYQSLTITGASGLTFDASSNFTGKVSGGGASVIGVITTAPNNLVHIIDSSLGTFLEDAGGQRIYGRITEASGVWTLSFYTNEAGVETAHNLSSSNIKIIFFEVFNQSSRPTIPSNPMEFGTLDLTSDILDAGLSNRGVLNSSLTPQSIGGEKEWNGEQSFLSNVINKLNVDAVLTGSNASGSLISGFGSIFTNASLTSIDTLSGAASSNNQFYVISNKTGSNITINHNIGAGGFYCPNSSNFILKNNHSSLLYYDVATSRWFFLSGGGSLFSLSAIGSSPNANASTYNPGTGSFNLEPANASFGGVVTTASQTFEGIKKFNKNISALIKTISSTGTGISISSTDREMIYRCNNSGLVSVGNIVPDNTTDAHFIVLMNATGVSITILNDSTGTASDRILTGTGSDLTLANGASLFLAYDYVSTRWRIIGGSGSGGGVLVSGSRGTPNVISSTGITSSHISTTANDQVVFIEGSTSGVATDVTSNPQIVAHTIVGSKLRVIGRNSDKPVKLENDDGLELNGSIDLVAGGVLDLMWDGTYWIECGRSI